MDAAPAQRALSNRKQKPPASQEPFARARPWLVASCALGLGAGFVLASVLSVTQALALPLGIWWPALVQAHGHMQLFGWAGLLVIGVALHFLPRLRGSPLAYPGLASWPLAFLAGGLALRVISQPLLALGAANASLWRLLLACAGLAEFLGASCIVGLLCLTLARGPSLASRPALLAFLPYALVGLLCFWLALALNAAAGFWLLQTGQALLPGTADTLTTQLGLFGFLVPLALGMAVRVLPLYLGLRPLPARVLWPIFSVYVIGLALSLLALWISGGALAGFFQSGAALLMGSALLTFILFQGMLLRQRQARLMVPAVQTQRVSLPARPYSAAQGNDRAAFGPFAWLIRSAFGWLALSALALLVNGATQLAGGFSPISADAIRHATTVGFVMLLIFGVAQRMLPGFAGGKLRSPQLVTATLWLGSAAAFLRVFPVLVSSWISALGLPGWVVPLLRGAFGCSGPLALGALLCFTFNLWSILRGAPRAKAVLSTEDKGA
ncbi:MAG TPA: hypothetical protein VFU32_15680 [Ktedonobacterales bacterium]|nr:hypothetical protein [Ktedonobacterales bacterium]